MQFIYHVDAKNDQLVIDGELYKYLFKVRRKKVDDIIHLRNMLDQTLYQYKIELIDRKKAILRLLNSEVKIVKHSHSLHIGWCVVDPKTIEKNLTSLNEMGVDRITFIYCEYSQKSFKINIERLEKILINSSQQCGRSSIMKLEVIDTLEIFIQNYPDTYFIDFSEKKYSAEVLKNIDTIVIGCEGGFSQNEREQFDQKKIIGFDTPNILKSETAVLGICSKILL